MIAVCELIYHTLPAIDQDHTPRLSLGSNDARHHEVLLFAARELERIAGFHPGGSEG